MEEVTFKNKSCTTDSFCLESESKRIFLLRFLLLFFFFSALIHLFRSLLLQIPVLWLEESEREREIIYVYTDIYDRYLSTLSLFLIFKYIHDA